LLESIIFSILALFLIIGAISMISFKESVYSAISFLLVMIATSGIFALLHQSFLFLAQILVSVGAVVTLSLMIITSINIKKENLPKHRVSFKSVIFSIILISPIISLIFYAISSLDIVFKEVNNSFGTIESIGKTLFSNWILPFEIVSILLLSALIGSIIISKRRLNI